MWVTGQTGNYEFLKLETAGEKKNVGVVTLNRPKVLNALCDQLMNEIIRALEHFNSDSSIAAIVLTGSEKAFAAGKIIRILFYILLFKYILQKIKFGILVSFYYLYML